MNRGATPVTPHMGGRRRGSTERHGRGRKKGRAGPEVKGYIATGINNAGESDSIP